MAWQESSASPRESPVFVPVAQRPVRKVLIAVLAHRYYMLTGQKQNLLRSFEFLQIADVAAIHPHPGSFFDLGLSYELNFSHHLVTSKDRRSECPNEGH